MFKIKAVYQEKDFCWDVCSSSSSSGGSASSDSDRKRKKSKKKEDSRSERDGANDVVVGAIAAGIIVSTLE